MSQTALTQLGLTEAAARTFLFDELKSPTIHGRRSAIAIAGTRAFYRLPPSARGPAASGLFAWARAYVNSPTFRKAYADLRQRAIPQERQHEQTVDEAVTKQIDELLAGIRELRQAAGSMPAADRAKVLESTRQQEEQFRSPEFARRLRTALEAERAEARTGAAASERDANERYPADPDQLCARRLREFLAHTADAD